MSNQQPPETTCQHSQCDCKVSHRKSYTSLGYGDEDGLGSGEYKVFVHHMRGGNIDLFLQNNPEYLMIQKELREEEIEEARLKIVRILTELTERQKLILYMRAEHYSAHEIAQSLGLCERTIFYEWKQIRDIAHSCLYS